MRCILPLGLCIRGGWIIHKTKHKMTEILHKSKHKMTEILHKSKYKTAENLHKSKHHAFSAASSAFNAAAFSSSNSSSVFGK